MLTKQLLLSPIRDNPPVPGYLKAKLTVGYRDVSPEYWYGYDASIDLPEFYVNIRRIE